MSRYYILVKTAGYDVQEIIQFFSGWHLRENQMTPTWEPMPPLDIGGFRPVLYFTMTEIEDVLKQLPENFKVGSIVMDCKMEAV